MHVTSQTDWHSHIGGGGGSKEFFLAILYTVQYNKKKIKMKDLISLQVKAKN